VNGELGKVIRRMAQQGKSVNEIHEIAYVYCAIFNARLVKDSTIDKITEHYTDKRSREINFLKKGLTR